MKWGCSLRFFSDEPTCRLEKAPASLWEGERSEVAEVNDSPVDCQSRHKLVQASASLWEGGGKTVGFDGGREPGNFLLS